MRPECQRSLYPPTPIARVRKKNEHVNGTAKVRHPARTGGERRRICRACQHEKKGRVGRAEGARPERQAREYGSGRNNIIQHGGTRTSLSET